MLAWKRHAAITGIGETEYSKASGMTQKALNMQAATRAIEDAGLRPRDVDGVIASTSEGGLAAEEFIVNLGIPVLRFSVGLHMGGASGVAGIECAAMAVALGVAKHVLVVSGRNGYSGARISQAKTVRGDQAASPTQLTWLQFEAPFGVIVPMHWYGLVARRHMHLYGTTSRQLGAVAVTMRQHAALNPKAIMKAPITIEDHQQSRMVSDPFHLFDCCIETDGATAILVSSAERAADLKQQPAFILGVAAAYPDAPIGTRPDLTHTGVDKAAPRAFEMADLSPKDIRLAELYDPFTIMPILHLESLGICDPGEGGPFVESGGIGLGGRVPVNTHGGLHSQAHSMSGLNHVAEAVKQLRGVAGPAQVREPDPCVVTGFGGFGAGSVAILGS
jgi:acetyl-CoA acetyltransferase